MNKQTIRKLNEDALFWHFIGQGDTEFIARKRAQQFLAQQNKF